MSPDAASRAILDALPIIVWTADAEGAVTWFNRRWYDLTGLSEAASLGFAFTRGLPPGDVDATLERWDDLRREGASFEQRVRIEDRAHGGPRWFLVRGEARRDATGRVEGWTGTGTDVDAMVVRHQRHLGRLSADLRSDFARQRRRERQRAALFRRVHAALAASVEESLQGDPDAASYYQRVLDRAVALVPGAQAGSLIRSTARGDWVFLAVAGYDRRLMDLRLPPPGKREPAEADAPRIVHGYTPHPALGREEREVLYGPIGRAADIRSSLRVPVWIGEELQAVLNLDEFDHPDGFGSDALELGRLFGRLIGSHMQRKELESDLMHQARTDFVTGIPNRREAEDRLAAWLEQGREGTVLFVDLDDFKHINEAHGHPVGDEVLRQVAGRIDGLLTRDALLARWGGDEFIVIAPEVSDPGAATGLALDLEAALRTSFEVLGRRVATSASVGVSMFGDGPVRLERVVREADIALNQAKRAGKRRVVFFSEPMGAQTSRRFAIQTALREALASEDGALRVHYQARVEPETCRIVGVEALSRWTHPELGELSPAEFVPIAEAAGLIDDLTRWVLDHAVREARRWRDAGAPRVVSVNLSAACVRRESIVDDIRDALERHDLPPSLLELEVTETAAMSGLQESIENLERLRAMGVSLSIDDFGTAYSSLTYLRLLPVDTIKVDRSFVSHIADDANESPTESSIVRGIVALGRSLGMRVVAEGVETEAQADFLTHLGCDGMQGFYFGAAQPAEAIVDGRAR